MLSTQHFLVQGSCRAVIYITASREHPHFSGIQYQQMTDRLKSILSLIPNGK